MSTLRGCRVVSRRQSFPEKAKAIRHQLEKAGLILSVMELTLTIGVVNPYKLYCAYTINRRRMVSKSIIYSHVVTVVVTTAFSITRLNDKQGTMNHVTLLK